MPHYVEERFFKGAAPNQYIADDIFFHVCDGAMIYVRSQNADVALLELQESIVDIASILAVHYVSDLKELVVMHKARDESGMHQQCHVVLWTEQILAQVISNSRTIFD